MNTKYIYLSILFLIISASTTTAATYGFQGQDGNAQTGLLNLQFRSYDSTTGTFLQKDPTGLQDDLNQYKFVKSNPVNITDPTGLWGVGFSSNDTSNLVNLGIGNPNIIFTPSSLTQAGQGLAASLDGIVPFFHPFANAGAYNANDPILQASRIVGGAGFSTLLGVGITKAYTIPNTVYHYTSAASAASIESSGTINASASAVDALLSGNVGGGGLFGSGVYVSGASIPTLAVGAQSTDAVFMLSSEGLGLQNTLLPFVFKTPGTSISLAESQITTAIPTTLSSIPGSLFGITSAASNISFGTGGSSLDVGGVLIDKAATLVGSNLSDIKGVTYDPVAKQLVFLGSNNINASTAINMDYFYTAVQAVYGSAVPPSVSLDPAAEMATPWTDWGNGDGIWNNNELNGFTLHYKPIWLQQDTSVQVEIQASSGATNYTIKVYLDAVSLDGSSGIKITAPGGYVMRLVYDSAQSSLPPGIFFDGTPFQNGSLVGGFTTTATGEDAYWGMVFSNQTGQNLTIRSVTVHPDRQHRRYGGRVDSTKLGWVMAEADRVMKCLGVGVDNLTGAAYSSATVSVPGYKNLLERAQAGGSAGGYTRLWFVPNDMTLQRYIDPVSGQASVVFQSSTVKLLTQSYLLGQPEDPLSKAFADNFNANYDQFASLNFPVHDPTDPTGVATINVPIFALLKQAMQAVTLARFFRDNNIPLDKWWLNSYQPPVAYSPKTVPTAYNSLGQGAAAYTVFGGVEIYKPNSYVPSLTARDVGLAVTGTSHPDPSNPGQDIQLQNWNASTTLGTLNAVSASFTTDSQNGNIKLAETDLSFASPGELPLTFTRYYQSSYLGSGVLGPGWRSTRYALQFSNPSWYDETHIMIDGSSNAIATDSNADTRLRSGTVRLVDLETGQLLDFQSSLGLAYTTNSLGQPQVTITGLATGDVPSFTAGQNQSGAMIAQMTDSTKSYKVTFADGSYLLFDNNGNLTQTTDRHSYTKWYAYDGSGRLSTITDNATTPQIITLVYSTTAPYLLQTAYGPSSSNSASNTDSTNYNYDTNTPPRLKSVVQNRSNVMIAQYSYDTANQLADVTSMDGTKPITTTADLRGRSLMRKNGRGNASNWTFSPKDVNGARVTTAADAASGLTLQQQADTLGRALYTKDTMNNYTMYNYTGNSMMPNSIQLPTPSDLQVAASQPAISIGRNAYGLLTSYSNPGISGSQSVGIHYTSANLPDHVTDTAGRAIDAFYTTSNNLHILRQYHNSQNIDTTLGYLNEFVNTLADPMSHTWTYGRDSMGRLTSIKDPTGVTVKYDYDTFGRLWHQYDPKVDPTLVSPAMTYSYDNLDRVTDITTPSGTTHYDYDPVTQWTKTSTETTTDGQITKVQYGYNTQTGDTTSATTTYQLPTIMGGGTQSVTSNYGYDTYGNLKTVTPPGAQPVNFSYNSVGQYQGTSETNSGLTTGPSIVANNATSGSWTNVNSQTFTWGPPVSSIAVTGYNYAKDASTATTVNTTSLTQAWNAVSDGQHTFRVRAQDSAGNWSPESTFNLWVDTTPPAVSIVSVTPNPIPQGNVTVTVTANVTDAGSGLMGTPQIRWCVSSDSSRNWSSYVAMTAGAGSQWSNSFVEPGTGTTLYYQIQTQDNAGNIGTYNGSSAISGPSGSDGPLMPPLALALLLILFFAMAYRVLHQRAPKSAVSA